MKNDIIIKVKYDEEALERFYATVARLTKKLERIKELVDETMGEQNKDTDT